MRLSPRKEQEMNITDPEALKELKRVRSWNLQEDVAEYPENEREGRSDMQFLTDECSYILSNFQEDGHALCEDLQEAREILRKTKNGKQVPLWQSTLKPVWDKHRIESARDTVNEYNRLKSLMKRLNDKGFYGKW